MTLLLAKAGTQTPPAAGGAPFSPSDLGANLWGWYKDTGMAGVDGDPLAQWDDASGNARHLAQGTSSKRPSKQTNEINSLPVARFDGVDDYLQVTGTFDQPVHLFVVVKFLGAFDAAHRTVFDSAAGDGYRRFFGRVSSTVMEAYAGAVLDSAATTPQAFHYYSVLFSGASSSIRIDGAASASGNAGTDATASGLNVGASGSLGQIEQANIDVAEIIACSAAISGADLTNVESYLDTRFGL